MDRILGIGPFISAIAAVFSVFVISFLNVHIFTRRKKTGVTIFANTISAFVLLSMIFYAISMAVFVLPMSNVYTNLSRSFILFAATGLITLAVIFIASKKIRGTLAFSHNIPNTLKNIDDIVFIFDDNGKMTYINYKDKLYELLGDNDNLAMLCESIFDRCGVTLDNQISSENILDAFELPLHFEALKRDALLAVSPILPGSNSGFIGVLRDVTQISESRRKLLRQNQELQKANALLSEYIETKAELEAENKRLEIIGEIKATLISDIESALVSLRAISPKLHDDYSHKVEMKRFAVNLREIYKTVRQVVSRINGGVQAK